MIRFRLDDQPYAIPSSWSELGEKQLLAVIPLSYGNKDDVKLRLKVLRTLVPKLKLKLVIQLDESDKFELIRLTDWVWEQPMEGLKIDRFEHADEQYLLPKPELDDTVAIEFAMADIYLKNFIDTSDSAWLDRLIATICRPSRPEKELKRSDWDGVERERYNGAIADRRTATFKSLALPYKVIALQAFVAQQRFMHSNYDIFSKGGGEGSGGGIDIGWVSLLYDLAEQATFGDFDKVCYTNMNTICMYLHKKAMQRNDE